MLVKVYNNTIYKITMYDYYKCIKIKKNIRNIDNMVKINKTMFGSVIRVSSFSIRIWFYCYRN